MNIKVKFDKNPYRSALTRKSKAMEAIKAAIPYFETLKKKPLVGISPTNKMTELRNKKKTVLKKKNASKIISKKRKISDRPPCFDSFVQTLNGILRLFESEEKKSYAPIYLLTNRLNQDPAENLFSVFRQSNGYSRNPTARTLRTSFRKASIKGLLENVSKYANCQDDGDEFVDTLTSSMVEEENVDTKGFPIVKPVEIDSYFDEPSADKELLLEPEGNCETIKVNNHISLENCSVKYFSGALLNKCMRKFKCVKCEEQLQIKKTDLSRNHHLIYNRNYSNITKNNGLKAPHDLFYEIIYISSTIFEKVFSAIYEEKHLLNSIVNKIFENEKVIQWINAIETCKDHKVFVIESMITSKIHYKANKGSIPRLNKKHEKKSKKPEEKSKKPRKRSEKPEGKSKKTEKRSKKPEKKSKKSEKNSQVSGKLQILRNK